MVRHENIHMMVLQGVSKTCAFDNQKQSTFDNGHGPHGVDVSNPLGHVKIIPLPPNCTSVHQPMDNGITTALKQKY